MEATVVNQVRRPGQMTDTPSFASTSMERITAAAFGFFAISVWLAIADLLVWMTGCTVVLVVLTVTWFGRYPVPARPEHTKQRLKDWLLHRDRTPFGSMLVAAGSGNSGDTSDNSDDDIPNEENDDGSEMPTRSEAEAWLFAAGVIVPCEREDDLCLDDEFRTDWYDQIDRIRESESVREVLAEELDHFAHEIEFDDEDDAYIAHCNSEKVGHWRSRAAMFAEIAAVRELPDWFDGWDDLSTPLRRNILYTLRIFLDVCPLCNESVSIGMEPLDKSDQSEEVFTGICEGCEARMFEMPAPESA